MYRKLVKYEFGATAKVFLPLLGLLILFTGTAAWGVARRPVAQSSFFNTVRTTSIILFIITAIVLAGSVLVMTILRVRRTLLGDEGYITFTLPVSIDKVLWAKLTVSGFWYVISALIGAACVYVMMRCADAEGVPTIHEMISALKYANRMCLQDQNYSLYLMLAQWALTAVLFVLAMLILIFFCLSVGHLVRKGQLILAIGVYFVINNVIGLLLPVRWLIRLASESENLMHFLLVTWGVLTGGVIVLGVLLYIGTRLILKHRLNLQ